MRHRGHDRRAPAGRPRRLIAVPGFGLLFAVGGLVALVLALVRGVRDGEELSGIGAAVGLFFTTARRDDYRFDVRRRVVLVTRRGLFGTKGGTLPFDEIEHVGVQREAATAIREILEKSRAA